MVIQEIIISTRLLIRIYFCLWFLFSVRMGGVFRSISNTNDGAFSKISRRHLPINYFCNKLYQKCFWVSSSSPFLNSGFLPHQRKYYYYYCCYHYYYNYYYYYFYSKYNFVNTEVDNNIACCLANSCCFSSI